MKEQEFERGQVWRRDHHYHRFMLFADKFANRTRFDIRTNEKDSDQCEREDEYKRHTFAGFKLIIDRDEALAVTPPDLRNLVEEYYGSESRIKVGRVYRDTGDMHGLNLVESVKSGRVFYLYLRDGEESRSSFSCDNFLQYTVLIDNAAEALAAMPAEYHDKIKKAYGVQDEPKAPDGKTWGDKIEYVPAKATLTGENYDEIMLHVVDNLRITGDMIDDEAVGSQHIKYRGIFGENIGNGKIYEHHLNDSAKKEIRRIAEDVLRKHNDAVEWNNLSYDCRAKITALAKSDDNAPTPLRPTGVKTNGKGEILSFLFDSKCVNSNDTLIIPTTYGAKTVLVSQVYCTKFNEETHRVELVAPVAAPIPETVYKISNEPQPLSYATIAKAADELEAMEETMKEKPAKFAGKRYDIIRMSVTREDGRDSVAFEIPATFDIHCRDSVFVPFDEDTCELRVDEVSADVQDGVATVRCVGKVPSSMMTEYAIYVVSERDARAASTLEDVATMKPTTTTSTLDMKVNVDLARVDDAAEKFQALLALEDEQHAGNPELLQLATIFAQYAREDAERWSTFARSLIDTDEPIELEPTDTDEGALVEYEKATKLKMQGKQAVAWIAVVVVLLCSLWGASHMMGWL